MFNLDTYSFFHLFLGSAARGLTCPHCGVGGIAKKSKLLLHIERMHSQRITCIICNVEFVDKFFFNQHSPHCYYHCTFEGCNFKDKRLERMRGHLRRHSVR